MRCDCSCVLSPEVRLFGRLKAGENGTFGAGFDRDSLDCFERSRDEPLEHELKDAKKVYKKNNNNNNNNNSNKTIYLTISHTSIHPHLSMDTESQGWQRSSHPSFYTQIQRKA
jgi:hypothetical protein